jgi:L-fucose mutarotase
MLKNIPKHLSPDLLWALAAMGHGDCLAVVDANYPAYSRHQRILPIVGVPLVSIIADILQLMPVDDFIEKPVVKMVPDGDLSFTTSVHDDVEKIVNEIEQRQVSFEPVERTRFYDVAARAFAVVATTDDRPFGCFIFTKGVIRSV